MRKLDTKISNRISDFEDRLTQKFSQVESQMKLREHMADLLREASKHGEILDDSKQDIVLHNVMKKGID